MERKPRTLKSTLIEPFVQIRLGIYVLAVTFPFMALIGSLIIFAFYEQYKQLMDIFHVVGAANQLELVQNQVFKDNVVRIATTLVLYIASLLGVIFWATHRIFGPVVAFYRFLDQMSEGSYQARVTLRKKDALQGLAEKLNLMAESLEERHGRKDRRNREEDQNAS